MKQAPTVRKKWVSFRVTPEEYKVIQAHQRKTTSQKMSEYARLTLLQKPVIVKYRNQTADDFLPVLILIKDALNGIGNNFNQAVRKLNALKEISEFRSWIARYDPEKKRLLETVDEMKEKLNEIYQWLQR